MTDPLTMRNLNVKPATLTGEQIHEYISRFDRKTSHLLGIFEKESGRLIGISAIYIDATAASFCSTSSSANPTRATKAPGRSRSTRYFGSSSRTWTFWLPAPPPSRPTIRSCA
jgi:hypothetical protein